MGKGNRGAAVIVSAVSVSVVRHWVQRQKKNKKIAINGNQTAYSSGFFGVLDSAGKCYAV